MGSKSKATTFKTKCSETTFFEDLFSILDIQCKIYDTEGVEKCGRLGTYENNVSLSARNLDFSDMKGQQISLLCSITILSGCCHETIDKA